ncbi:Exopolyphosphatase [Mortierella polycephala]|uniref:Exopolyphosphatase n=1 Tax=Mortierella polycephala TaxID=41804 RepID=A0A9P6TYC6_9FUNG|nr:Exopolyphosphatase [Mortierella polycephala]
MDVFLASGRAHLTEETSTEIVVVTGNESADLDSIISAITTSFFLSHLQVLGGNPIIVPFINIPKSDLALRSDVLYILSSNDINIDNVYFRDDLPLLEQFAAKNPDQLSLFLVDHNIISETMASLAGVKVKGVIDHHVDEQLYKDTAKIRRIETVGSCTSLVADEFLRRATEKAASLDHRDGEQDMDEKHRPNWIKQATRMLLGAVLIDTVNLNPDYKKVTPLDLAVAKEILPYTGWDNTDGVFGKIDKARRDTSQLSWYDLLRKDYKEWTVSRHGSDDQTVKVGFSSVTGLVEKYVKRDGVDTIHKDIKTWSKTQDLDLLVIMLSDDLGEHQGGYQRQVILNPITDKVGGFVDQFEALDEPKFERIKSIDTDSFTKEGGRAYRQHNTALSRKQLWPMARKLLTEPPSQQTPNL